MAANNQFEYDAFISYTNADRPWAEKLNASLKAESVRPYLDQPRLEVGTPWEPQLTAAVDQSRHLIVVWSNKTKDSDWVRRELGRFENKIDPAAIGQAPLDRRMFFLNLEGENKAFGSFQMINELRDRKVYESQPNALPADLATLWNDVVAKLARAILKDDSHILVPLSFVAMTASEFSDLEKIRPKVVQDIANNLNITVKELRDRYGETRSDWRPFGNTITIWRMMEKLRLNINDKAPYSRIRWYVADFVSAPFYEARDMINRLLPIFSVITIDPISFYDPEVYRRFMLLNNYIEKDQSALLVLLPVAIPTSHGFMRELVKERGAPLFDFYYNPPVPATKTYVQCGMNIGDDWDIERLLLTALGRYTKTKSRRRHPATSI